MLTPPINKHKFNTISVFLTVMVFCVLPFKVAIAGLEDDFRRLLTKQVFEEVSDKSLAADIVEIRFRREFEKWKGNSSTIQESIIGLNKTSFPSDDALRKLSLKNFGSSYAAYGGVGNRFFGGFSSHLNKNFRWRSDVSVYSSSDKSQILNGSSYVVEKKDYSLGSYIDWYPFEKNFKLSAGININRMGNRPLEPKP